MKRATSFCAVVAALIFPMLLPWQPIEAQKASARDAMLTTPGWLAQHLKDPNLVILQVGPQESYDTAHVPGARLIGMKNVSVPGADGKLSLELPSADSLRAAVEAFGISDDTRIVIVQSDEWFSPSTRIMFTLDYLGLGDHTTWLDGGTVGWRAAGQPLTTVVPTVVRGKLSKRPTKPLVVDYTYVQSHGATPGVHLIDARSPVFYEGPEHGQQKAGHVKGATNLPFDTMFGDSSRVLSTAALTEKFRAAGVQLGDTVVAFCHVGQQATAVLFGARLLGHPVKLYDGSYDDWNARKLPLENAKANTPAVKKDGVR